MMTAVRFSATPVCASQCCSVEVFPLPRNPVRSKSGRGSARMDRLSLETIASKLPRMYWRRAVFFAVIGAAFTTVISTRAIANDLAAPARQLVVCLAPQTSSFEGSLQLFSRDAAGNWRADGSPWPVLFARDGLAWGRGLNPFQPGPQKISDDRRNP